MLINLILQVSFQQITEDNVVTRFIFQDIGGSVPSNIVIKDCAALALEYCPAFTTGISECMKLNLGEILEFLMDFHAISKIKVQLYTSMN